MAGNETGSSSGGGGASISVAAAAVGSADARFAVQERRSSCFGGLSCFGSQKHGKRIVPASRALDRTASTSRGPQSAGPSDQNSTRSLSLLAPPSSPASFTNSALPSTAHSPSGPTPTMFMTGPYAHETQLVSPPVLSTFTTEPSTAPLTPPPELAHLTTPSSPDVPFAQYLSSNFFCPAASAQFYLDQAQQQPYGSGTRHGKACAKQEEEVVEAYRASFGFSADEMADPAEDSFAMSPFGGGVHPLKIGDGRLSKSLHRQSCSDAEIEYRRGGSLKDAHNNVLGRRN